MISTDDTAGFVRGNYETVGYDPDVEAEKQRHFLASNILTLTTIKDANTGLYHKNGTSSILGEVGPELPAPHEFFRATQKWEGYVLCVGSDSFIARLIPIVGEGPGQDAEIYIEAVHEDDRSFIVAGAVFYWSIGYLDRRSGRRLVSQIIFRRLPPWTKRDLQNAEAEAKRISDALGPE